MGKFEPSEVPPEKFEISRRRFLRNVGVAAATVPFAGFVVDTLMDMPAGASERERRLAGQRAARNSVFESVYASHSAFTFTFVNHVTTNPFFVPTRYGAADACALLGHTTYNWTGSTTAIVGEMVAAFDAAIAAHVNGIATTVVASSAFEGPTNKALHAGIPVVAYNSDGNTLVSADVAANHQLSYVGQDLYESGVQAGNHILQVVKKGELVSGFIATPGALNIQPRIDGASSVLKPAGVVFDVVPTGALLSQEATATEAWYLAHKDVKFMYAVDAGSTSSAAAVVLKYGLKGVVYVGGFDFLTTTVTAIANGSQLWTIDQQPYLQGFLPVLQLFQYNVSGGLVAPVQTDTGLKFVYKAGIGPYTKLDRYEGSSTSPVTIKPPTRIAV